MSIQPNSKWNDERADRLKELHRQGVTFEQMTRDPMFRGLGFTRNAMIGKATRMGLTQRSPELRAINQRAETPKADVVWTADRNTLLRKLWPDPELSAARIAVQINAETQTRTPLTKMAIIARAGRLSLGPKPVVEIWPAEAVEALIALWADEDLSTSEIARRMERTWHAVHNKAAALGLPKRKPETAGATAQPGPDVGKAAAERRQAAMAAIKTDPVRFDMLTAERCKFPIEDPPPGEGMDHMVCCGARRVPDKPYCEGHLALSRGVLKPHQPKDGKALERQLRRFA